jgi:hypothetical protein
LLGVSLVLLIVSLVVTALTQFTLAVFNSRGRNLHKGLSDLLEQIDPAVAKNYAHPIADAVLKHPLIAGKGGRRGEVVHREEFIKLLLV